MGALRYILAAAGTLLLMCACNNDGCTDNLNALPLARFYVTTPTGGEQNVAVDSLEIGGVGAPADSLLITVNRRVSELYLPFRATDNVTSFFIRYRAAYLDLHELVDTLTATYDATTWFASEACGATFRYRITGLRYTRHLIDSIAVPDSLVTNVPTTTFKIYFRTES